MPGKSYSRIDSIDPNERNYVVVHPETGNLYFAAVPYAQLSYQEEEPHVYIQKETILTDRFSKIFHVLFMDNMHNAVTKFVDKPKTGWSGPRFVPIKFVVGDPPCFEADDAFLDTTATRFLKEFQQRFYDPNIRQTRRMETAAINDTIKHPIPRSVRRVYLFHWVTDGSRLFHALQRKGQYVYASQYVDFHSHPAWFWPKAHSFRGMRTLLVVDCPNGTPMLRIDRHSSFALRASLLKTGQWTHAETDSNETEVRLPPSRYLLLAKPTVELHAGEKVLLVFLQYDPEFTFPSCADLPAWKRSRSKRQR